MLHFRNTRGRTDNERHGCIVRARNYGSIVVFFNSTLFRWSRIIKRPYSGAAGAVVWTNLSFSRGTNAAIGNARSLLITRQIIIDSRWSTDTRAFIWSPDYAAGRLLNDEFFMSIECLNTFLLPFPAKRRNLHFASGRWGKKKIASMREYFMKQKRIDECVRFTRDFFIPFYQKCERADSIPHLFDYLYHACIYIYV
jgi:hypothetical protein